LGGPIHRFTHLSFNDIRAEDADVRVELPKDVPRASDNRVNLSYRLYRAGGPDTLWDNGVVRSSAQLFKPAGFSGGPWRALTILVTPEKIAAHWGAEDPVGELSTADLPGKIRKTLNLMRKLRPSDPSVDQVDTTFSPRGSLGLYVLNGSASFRNVIIEPLGEAD
ncbi:MAG TPA: hypothetical protein VKD72_37860, partial [Gemmataceae bacterium]|nr:hypothetical protein [Gemmataceae bacterium]